MEYAPATIPVGYKQTEVGVIPEDWDVETFGDVGEVKMCRRIFNHETNTVVGIPFYKIGTFGKNADAYISRELFNTYRRKFSFPKPGSVLISAAGTIGRTVVYGGEEAYFQDSNIVWIQHNEELISNKFLYHLLEIAEYTTEGGTIQRLYNSILLNTKFLCPPKSEQRNISEVLDDINFQIDRIERLIEKLRGIKQGTMQELLTGKTRLPGFSGEWRETTLGNIANFSKGSGLSKSVLNDGGRYKCILYGELFTTYSNPINKVHSGTNSLDGVLSKIGDILIPGSTTTTGIDLAKASALMKNNIALGGDINIISPHSPKIVNSIFLADYLTEIKKHEIAQNTQGITIIHLYGRDLVNLKLNLPSLDEQTAIANVLSDMDAEITALEQRLEKAKAIKQGMMQQLLTGRIRLVDPSTPVEASA